jgi:alkylation response protein AidB-like acyl-CoA dehydrogenase
MSVGVDGGSPRGSAQVRTLPRPVLRTSEEAVAVAEGFAEQISVDAIERDRSGQLPIAEMAAFDASGLLGITVPRQDGGGDLPIAAMADVARTIAAADSAIAQTPQAHYLMVDVLAVNGSDHQRSRVLGDVMAGRRIASALAERGGKHAQDLKTRLRPESGGVLLDGVKYYATGALTAHWIAVSALDEHDRVALAFVPREAAGVTLTDDWNVMGQRATVSGSVRFERVAVDPELVLPYWECFEVPQLLGARAQLYHAAIQVGLASGALEAARWFVTEKARPFFEATRAGWADTAAGDPHVIYRFGSLATQVRAAQTLRWHRPRRSRPTSRSPSLRTCSRCRARPPRTRNTTSAATGVMPVRMPATTRWIGSTTTSATICSAACCRPTTVSCDGGRRRSTHCRSVLGDRVGRGAALRARPLADRRDGRYLVALRRRAGRYDGQCGLLGVG